MQSNRDTTNSTHQQRLGNLNADLRENQQPNGSNGFVKSSFEARAKQSNLRNKNNSDSEIDDVSMEEFEEKVGVQKQPINGGAIRTASSPAIQPVALTQKSSMNQMQKTPKIQTQPFYFFDNLLNQIQNQDKSAFTKQGSDQKHATPNQMNQILKLNGKSSGGAVSQSFKNNKEISPVKFEKQGQDELRQNEYVSNTPQSNLQSRMLKSQQIVETAGAKHQKQLATPSTMLNSNQTQSSQRIKHVNPVKEFSPSPIRDQRNFVQTDMQRGTNSQVILNQKNVHIKQHNIKQNADMERGMPQNSRVNHSEKVSRLNMHPQQQNLQMDNQVSAFSQRELLQSAQPSRQLKSPRAAGAGNVSQSNFGFGGSPSGQNIDDQIVARESKVMRILRAKMSTSTNAQVLNKEYHTTAKMPNQSAATSKFDQDRFTSMQQNSAQLKQKTVSNNDLKIYKDGKVVATGGGLALINNQQKVGHRLQEGRSVANLDPFLLAKAQKQKSTPANLYHQQNSSGSFIDGSSASNLKTSGVNQHGSGLDQFIQRQLIDEARRKQKLEQAMQDKQEQQEKDLQSALASSKQLLFRTNQVGRNQMGQVEGEGNEYSARSFEQFYQSQLEFKHKVANKISHFQREKDQHLDQLKASAVPQVSKGSKKILQKYQSKEENRPKRNIKGQDEEDGDQTSPVAQESANSAYERLYQGKSLIPTVENRKQMKLEQNSQTHSRVMKSQRDQMEYMERLYTSGAQSNRDEGSVTNLKRSGSKWSNISTFQPELATKKSKTDKMIFDRLRREFHEFFKLDLYYASVCYASKHAYDHVDESFIQKATNLMNASEVVNSQHSSYQQVKATTYSRDGGDSEVNESVSDFRQTSQSRSLHKNSIANALYTAHESTQSVKTLKYILNDKSSKADARDGQSRSRGGANMFTSRTASKVSQHRSSFSQGRGVQNNSASSDLNQHQFRMNYDKKLRAVKEREDNENSLAPSEHQQLKIQQLNERVLRENILKGTPIRYPQYMKVMHSLGFLIEQQASTVVEEQSLAEIWKMLGGTKPSSNRTIKAENLFVFLCALLNIRLPILVQKGHDQEQLPEGHRYEGFLCFDEYENAHFVSYDDITKIHKKFKQLAMNRLSRKAENTLQSQRFTKEELLSLKAKGAGGKDYSTSKHPQFKISQGSKMWLENANHERAHSYSQRNFKLGIQQDPEVGIKHKKQEKIEYVTIDGEQVSLNDIKRRFQVKEEIVQEQKPHAYINAKLASSKNLVRSDSNKSVSQLSQISQMKFSPKAYSGKRIETCMITAVQDDDDRPYQNSSNRRRQVTYENEEYTQTIEDLEIPGEQRSNYNYSLFKANQLYSPSAGNNKFSSESNESPASKSQQHTSKLPISIAQQSPSNLQRKVNHLSTSEQVFQKTSTSNRVNTNQVVRTSSEQEVTLQLSSEKKYSFTQSQATDANVYRQQSQFATQQNEYQFEEQVSSEVDNTNHHYYQDDSKFNLSDYN